jgi:SOS-response transcriptional repressor LexA
MRLRCNARQFSLQAGNFSLDGLGYAPRLTLAQRNPADVRAIHIEPPRDAGVKTEPGVEVEPAGGLRERGIFNGHIEAGHAVALNQPEFINLGLTKSREKMTLPDWAGHLQALMDGERLSRKTFAAKLNITEQTVSNWLRGIKEPSPEHYFRMAKIWPQADQVPFLLKRAADKSGAFQIPGLDKMLGQRKKPAQSTHQAKFPRLSSEAAIIPLLKDPAAAGTPRQMQEREIDEMLPMPGTLCPHPDAIVCIRVEGDSMSPVLEAGYIVAVDTAQTERVRLYNQMVAARDPEGGVTIKWFRKSGTSEVLLPNHTSKRHQPVVLTPVAEGEQGWAIIGKVIWWIGVPT